MKKNRGLILLLLLLLIITGYFLFIKKNDSTYKELHDFAVKDTASITKIFLADRNGNTIKLDRDPKGKWTLNGNDQPKMDFLKLLFDVIYKIEVRSPVAKAAYNNVIKSLAAGAVKCEIYMHYEDKPFKTYYVGSQTEDALGTFMMIEKSSMPYITQVPGFNGYLTPRYSVKIEAWKNTILFNYAPHEIKSLMINYTNFPAKSFVISTSNGKYYVQNISTGKFIAAIDPISIENYFMIFQNIFYESWQNELKKTTRDSILQFGPSIRISINDSLRHLKEVEIYSMPITAGSMAKFDSLGNPLKYDPDRVYGLIKPGNELVTIQHQALDKLLRQYNDFDTSKPVKNKRLP